MSFAEVYKTPLRAEIYGKWLDFLTGRGLRDEGDADAVALVFDDCGRITAAGALARNTLKQIATDECAEGEGLCALVVTALVNEAASRGETRLFLCTKPQNARMFASLGFYELVRSDDAVLMESRPHGLSEFLASLEKPSGRVGAVVANCNPFTNGHLYLVEQAAARVDALHLFILSERGAEFSAAERYELAARGTAHIPNVYLHRSDAYLVSRATFPAYFVKDAARADEVRADLDILLFASRIAPALGVRVRFVGSEPFCPVTRAYNERMKQLLPLYGIELTELTRKDGISASRVRELMKLRDVESIRPLVPDATYEAVLRHLTANT